MSAHHAHDTEQPASPKARRLALALLVPIALITLGALVLLWPTQPESSTAANGPERVTGQVHAVDRVPCPALEAPEDAETPGGAEPPGDRAGPPDPPPTAPECGTVTVRLTSGAEAGEQILADLPTGPGAITVNPGDDVILLYLADSPDDRPYILYDHQRSTQLWLLGLAFALAVIAFGRWRGLTALFGLGITFGVLLFFVVPAILEGQSPLLIAVVGSAAIMLTVLYLTHGLNLTTTIAVIGTLASLTVTALLSALVTGATHLTGVFDDASSYLNITHSNVNMQGLLLAGIVIGSLGVLDDVTVTQSTAVRELARANPAYGFGQLYRSAERIGRAHIASVINTIVLAYAGASLPLLLLFAAGTDPIGEIMTNQIIAQELVRSAVGTLGLIAAVPITTALAAATARRSSGGPATSTGPATDGPVPAGATTTATATDGTAPARPGSAAPLPRRAAHPSSPAPTWDPSDGRPAGGRQPEPWLGYLDRPEDRTP